MDKPREITENDLIDFILQILYTNLDVDEMHLEKDILDKTKVELTEKQKEHVWELLMSTHLLNSSVGFGKTGRIYLNKHGVAMMKRHKSYYAILEAEQNSGSISHIQPPIHINTGSREISPENNAEEQGGDDMAH